MSPDHHVGAFLWALIILKNSKAQLTDINSAIDFKGK
ncbi:hypothetical protein VIS19158_22654 [Vibrio scophthalmi LMG 19158]|uniref:Uncharacterized protein n=1 Tax=Vibrio scophthalmi LMG 19158 TaxID=870967 RepID=F9RTI8_9VIBR|nr:hypothetical protein VIS19158_22654 [Vibrio scophthalmi LMG 19158]